jgi:hypothetical protein
MQTVIFWLGLVFGAICIAASLAFSLAYGLSYSDVFWIALIYAAVGVGSVIGEVTLVPRMDHLVRVRRFFAAFCAAVLFAACSVTTISYEGGFLATLFEGKASVGESKADDRASLQAERSRLQRQIDAAAVARPSGEVRGAMSELEAGPRWQSSKGCTVPTITESQTLCANHAKLKAELGRAEAVDAWQARIDQIRGLLGPLADAKVADARAVYLSRLIGTEDGARMAAAAMIIFLLWWGRVTFLFVYADPIRKAWREVHAFAMPATPAQEAAQAVEEATPAPLDPSDLFPPVYGDPEPFFVDEDAEEESDEAKALADMEEAELFDSLNAARKPVPTPPPLVTPIEAKARRCTELVMRYFEECFTHNYLDEQFGERAQILRDGFLVWLADSDIDEKFDPNMFGGTASAVLAHLGGERLQKFDHVFYRGVKFTPRFAHRIAQEAKPTAADEEKKPETRLGRLSKDRRGDLATIPAAASA